MNSGFKTNTMLASCSIRLLMPMNCSVLQSVCKSKVLRYKHSVLKYRLESETRLTIRSIPYLKTRREAFKDLPEPDGETSKPGYKTASLPTKRHDFLGACLRNRWLRCERRSGCRVSGSRKIRFTEKTGRETSGNRAYLSQIAKSFLFHLNLTWRS